MQVDESYVKTLLPERTKDSHKGTFGHVLNVAGSGFYTGAAYFSSVASLKVGSGRSTLASTETVLRAVSALSSDVILFPLAETKENTISPKAIKIIQPKLDEYNAISIGCGLSTNKETAIFFEKFIKLTEKSSTPIVIDADGLNILAGITPSPCPLPQGARVMKLNKNTILTPHPLEMARIMDTPVDEIVSKPEFWAQKCCEKYNCTVVLKIHKTVVTTPDGRIYINNTGNTALSKGGSGDVLCGMIAGFLAQGLSTFDASILGVYLHGKTAEIASKDLTEYSVLASELLNYIHLAIKAISSSH